MTPNMIKMEIIITQGNLFLWLFVVLFLKLAPFLPVVGIGALSFAFQFVFFPFYSNPLL